MSNQLWIGIINLLIGILHFFNTKYMANKMDNNTWDADGALFVFMTSSFMLFSIPYIFNGFASILSSVIFNTNITPSINPGKELIIWLITILLKLYFSFMLFMICNHLYNMHYYSKGRGIPNIKQANLTIRDGLFVITSLFILYDF